MHGAEDCSCSDSYINSQVEEDEYGKYMVYYSLCTNCGKCEVVDTVDLEEDMETQDDV
jgi:ferredoxin